MQQTSAIYKQILSGSHWAETRLCVAGDGRLITEEGDSITFGGEAIALSGSGADAGFGENVLLSVSTTHNLFSDGKPSVGCCVAGEIGVKMLCPHGEIARMAVLTPYMRVTNGQQNSEWLQKGVYYIDTREITKNDSGKDVLSLHAYDAMLRAEQIYPSSSLSWPAVDTAVLAEIAGAMDVPIDPRTTDRMTEEYLVGFPSAYTCREVLGYLGAMYAGNWIMSELGELRLIGLEDIPEETNYLVDGTGYAIVFGGDRILV